jgi:hypothetical protein
MSSKKAEPRCGYAKARGKCGAPIPSSPAEIEYGFTLQSDKLVPLEIVA